MRRALVAEDSSYVLFSLELVLEQNGVEIVGAAATLDSICKLADTVAADVAILDVNLNGEMVFPAADRLIERGIPIIFATGYASDENFPPRFAQMPILQKPYEVDKLVNLFGEGAFSRQTSGHLNQLTALFDALSRPAPSPQLPTPTTHGSPSVLPGLRSPTCEASGVEPVFAPRRSACGCHWFAGENSSPFEPLI